MRSPKEYVVTIGPFLDGSVDSHIRAVSRLRPEDGMALVMTKSSVGGVTVIHLSGAILFGEESNSLYILVKDLLNKTPQIVLDLNEVTRIDSSGLGTLVALHVSARKLGSDIKLASLGNHAKEVLHITRLETVLEVFGETEGAIASFKVVTTKG